MRLFCYCYISLYNATSLARFSVFTLKVLINDYLLIFVGILFQVLESPG